MDKQIFVRVVESGSFRRRREPERRLPAGLKLQSIGQVAGQTDILALDATIEAKRDLPGPLEQPNVTAPGKHLRVFHPVAMPAA